jgi:predicted Kef-type K+ transport protein
MLWLFLLLGLVGAPLGMLFGIPFIAGMACAFCAYLIGMAVGGFSVLYRARRVTFPLIDLAVFVVVVGIGYGFFGETIHQYLLFTLVVLIYTGSVALAFHLYCRHYRLGYREMLKVEARYVGTWMQRMNTGW